MFLMLLALVVFGPRRLPEIGRQIGKLMYEFRKVSNDFKFQMEEELRASEEAERQRKLAAEQAGRAAIEAAPQPAAEPAALELGAGAGEPEVAAYIGAESAAETVESAPAVTGEVRGEPRKFPNIQPPASGDPVAAQKPFRGRAEEVATESGDVASRELDAPVVVVDEGRIGTEVQPGVDTDMSARASHEAVAEAGSDKGQEVQHG